MQKVFIRGVAGRGKEVIAKLEALGGVNTWEYGGEEDAYFYITAKGEIDFTGCPETQTLFNWVGTEIFLDEPIEEKKPESKFKVGDKVYFTNCPQKGVYEIEDIHYIGNYECKFKNDYGWFSEGCLTKDGILGNEPIEKPKPEPKFKVGDKVHIMSDKSIYTITDRKDNGDCNLNGGGYYNERFLTPANTLKEFDPVMVSNDGEDWYASLFKDSIFTYHCICDNEKALKTYNWKYLVPHADFDFKDRKSNIKRSVIWLSR